MSSKSKGSSQASTAAKIKSNLKQLRELGLYAGDLRKRPTKYALRTIAKFDAVLKGNASVVRPVNPNKFKGIFEVKGNAVIVPRRKGEKITVDKKTGEIVSKRKVGGRTITARGKQIKRGENIPKPGKERRVQYAVPFNSRGGGTTWMRFPDWDTLQKFMAGYDYKGWQEYVVEEDIGREFTPDQLKRKVTKQLKAAGKTPAKRKTKRGRKSPNKGVRV